MENVFALTTMEKEGRGWNGPRTTPVEAAERGWTLAPTRCPPDMLARPYGFCASRSGRRRCNKNAGNLLVPGKFGRGRGRSRLSFLQREDSTVSHDVVVRLVFPPLLWVTEQTVRCFFYFTARRRYRSEVSNWFRVFFLGGIFWTVPVNYLLKFDQGKTIITQFW